jgi:hypothetical protein
VSRRKAGGGRGFITPAELLALPPRGLRGYRPLPGEHGRTGEGVDRERYSSWSSARMAWYRAAGVDLLTVIRAGVHRRDWPFEPIPAPERLPDPHDPRWAEWIEEES